MPSTYTRTTFSMQMTIVKIIEAITAFKNHEPLYDLPPQDVLSTQELMAHAVANVNRAKEYQYNGEMTHWYTIGQLCCGDYNFMFNTQVIGEDEKVAAAFLFSLFQTRSGALSHLRNLDFARLVKFRPAQLQKIIDQVMIECPFDPEPIPDVPIPIEETQDYTTHVPPIDLDQAIDDNLNLWANPDMSPEDVEYFEIDLSSYQEKYYCF